MNAEVGQLTTASGSCVLFRRFFSTRLSGSLKYLADKFCYFNAFLMWLFGRAKSDCGATDSPVKVGHVREVILQLQAFGPTPDVELKQRTAKAECYLPTQLPKCAFATSPTIP